MNNSIIEDLRRASESETLVCISLRLLKNDKIHCQRFYQKALVGQLDEDRDEVALYVKDKLPEDTWIKRIESIKRICEINPA
jgi:hypothetical protein